MCSVLTEVLDWSGGGLLTSAELYKLEKLLFSSSLSLSELNTTHSNVMGLTKKKNIAKVTKVNVHRRSYPSIPDGYGLSSNLS